MRIGITIPKGPYYAAMEDLYNNNAKADLQYYTGLEQCYGEYVDIIIHIDVARILYNSTFHPVSKSDVHVVLNTYKKIFGLDISQLELKDFSICLPLQMDYDHKIYCQKLFGIPEGEPDDDYVGGLTKDGLFVSFTGISHTSKDSGDDEIIVGKNKNLCWLSIDTNLNEIFGHYIPVHEIFLDNKLQEIITKASTIFLSTLSVYNGPHGLCTCEDCKKECSMKGDKYLLEHELATKIAAQSYHVSILLNK